MTPDLAASYARCRALLAHHGRTYYLASRLLPKNLQPAVWALYGFARYVDDLVDVDLNRVPDASAVDAIEAGRVQSVRLHGCIRGLNLGRGRAGRSASRRRHG